MEKARHLLDANITKWTEFNENYSSFKGVLCDIETIVKQDEEDKIDHCNIQHLILRYEVYNNSFLVNHHLNSKEGCLTYYKVFFY